MSEDGPDDRSLQISEMYTWLERRLHELDVSGVDEKFVVCLSLFDRLCPQVTGACLRCTLSVYDRRMLDDLHDDEGCHAATRMMHKHLEQTPDLRHLEVYADVLIKEWRRMDNKYLLSALLYLAKMCAENWTVATLTEEGIEPYGGPCAYCLLVNVRPGMAVAGHDNERCRAATSA